MSEVDVSALKRFHETFAPAVAAIPAVTDALNGLGDLQRRRKVAEEELDKAQASIQDSYDEADKRLAEFNESIDKLTATRAELVQDIAKLETEKMTTLKDIAADAAAARREKEIEIAEVKKRLQTAQKDFAVMRSEAEKDMLSRQEALANQINNMEKRRDEIAASIEALKAKLG